MQGCSLKTKKQITCAYLLKIFNQIFFNFLASPLHVAAECFEIKACQLPQYGLIQGCFCYRLTKNVKKPCCAAKWRGIMLWIKYSPFDIRALLEVITL